MPSNLQNYKIMNRKTIKINRSFESQLNNETQEKFDQILNEIDHENNSNFHSQLMTSLSFSDILEKEIDRDINEQEDLLNQGKNFI